jgi:uncharacterized protein
MGLLDKLRAPEPPEIKDDREDERFVVRVDGRRAGYTAYRRQDGVLSLRHTEIDPEFEGRGLGGQLVAAILDSAEAAGEDVLPFCPFVREYIERHPDRLALVPAGRRTEFKLPA